MERGVELVKKVVPGRIAVAPMEMSFHRICRSEIVSVRSILGRTIVDIRAIDHAIHKWVAFCLTKVEGE